MSLKKESGILSLALERKITHLAMLEVSLGDNLFKAFLTKNSMPALIPILLEGLGTKINLRYRKEILLPDPIGGS